tara:strand:- start:16 stop:228 length:213 start_codon:yes stop_codon:yes gene_type:complete
MFWIIDKFMAWIRPKPKPNSALSRMVSDYEKKKQTVASPANISDDSHTPITTDANNDQETTRHGQAKRQH